HLGLLVIDRSPRRTPKRRLKRTPKRHGHLYASHLKTETKKTAQTWAGSVRNPVDAGSADGAPPSKRAALRCPPRGQPATDRLGPRYDTSATCCSGPSWVWRRRSMSAQTVKPSSGLPCTPIAKASLDTVSRP